MSYSFQYYYHAWLSAKHSVCFLFPYVSVLFGANWTASLIDMICDNTNVYGWLNILQKTSYADAAGGWTDVTAEEMNRFIGLIIFMGIVKVSSIQHYWSTSTLYHGLWARHFMPRNRFKALLGMLHVTDPGLPDDGDKLRKIRPLLNHIRTRCQKLYQADMNVSLDERMVKSKGRSGMRQFIRNKPVRFGFKLWVMAESSTGYTLDFSVYTGRRGNSTENGLAYDVVLMVCESLYNQGYHVYFDNFFT